MKTAVFRAALLVMALAGMLTLFAAVPAEAASSVTLRVFQCNNSSCSSKTAVSSGLVSDLIQLQATPNTSGLIPPSLKWVDIAVKPASSSSDACIMHVNNPSRGSAYTVNWNSASYPNSAPSGCASSSLYGNLTRNESITITARALDSSSGAGVSSASITVSLNNTPTPPAWAGGPSVSGASQRKPVVTLKWTASPEPDIQEYRFLRTDQSGTTKQYPVQASNPSAEGCSFDGTTYTCYDTDFPSSGFGGTYSYTLAAYRTSTSQADSCYYGGSPCIGAQSSDVRQVSISEPPAPAPTTTSGSGGGTGGGTTGGTISVGGSGGSPSGVPSGAPSLPGSTRDASQPTTNVLGQHQFNPGDCFTCGTYKETLPYSQMPGDGGTLIPGGTGQRPVLAAGAGLGGTSGPDPRQLWVSIAAGLVLLLTAGHVARVLRTTAH